MAVEVTSIEMAVDVTSIEMAVDVTSQYVTSGRRGYQSIHYLCLSGRSLKPIEMAVYYQSVRYLCRDVP
jgi:hypothetical protein